MGGFQATLFPRLIPAFPWQHVAKQAAASATQTIAAAQHTAASNKNPVVQQQLVQSCKIRGTGPCPGTSPLPVGLGACRPLSKMVGKAAVRIVVYVPI